jgi:small subunit ribosomal protein S20
VPYGVERPAPARTEPGEGGTGPAGAARGAWFGVHPEGQVPWVLACAALGHALEHRPSDQVRHIPTRTRGFRVANIKSQLKRIKTNEKARLRNKAVKSSLKTAVRRFRDAAAAGNRDAAVVELKAATRALDKAASKGVIHKNQAANKKSAMAQRAASL